MIGGLERYERRQRLLAVGAASGGGQAGFGRTEEMPLRDGYRYEQSQTAMPSMTEDTREAQLAFAEKRKPVFGPWA